MQSRLEDWKFEQLKSHKLFYFFHLTHVDNLSRILQHGILSHRELDRRGWRYRDISLESAQQNRAGRALQTGPNELRDVHEMVPLFLRSKTPMLYKRRELTPSLVFVLVNGSYVCRDDVRPVIADGNVASPATRDWYTFKFLDDLPWDVLNAEQWTDFPDGSRKRGAEMLVWPSIQPEGFWKVAVASVAAKSQAMDKIRESGRTIDCEVQARLFFDW